MSSVRANVVRALASELQTLINASRRVYENEHIAFEDQWLDSGLSAIAEELVFYRASVGLTPGLNIPVSMLTGGPSASRRVAAFNTFANNNFGAFRAWMQRPDTTGAFQSNMTIASQGVLWAFLRYAADRVGTTDQTAFWASLIDSNLEGKANLANAIGADPDEWLRDFIVAIYADDVVAGIAPEYTTRSWNYRSMLGALGGFTLGTRPLTNGTPLTLSYSRDGGTAFARFGVPSDAYARITALSGGVIPTSPFELAVTRTK